jgi:hypothetical protein
VSTLFTAASSGEPENRQRSARIARMVRLHQGTQ